MAKRRWKLATGRTVVTAFAEPAAGPGWANAPVWVVTRDGNQKYHLECIQPEEQSERLRRYYNISAVVHEAMVAAVCSNGEKES